MMTQMTILQLLEAIYETLKENNKILKSIKNADNIPPKERKKRKEEQS